MGCVSSKTATPGSPLSKESSGVIGQSSREMLAGPLWNRVHVEKSESSDSGQVSSSNGSSSQSFVLSVKNSGGFVEGECGAAGWPSWLCLVAAEAVSGMVPLRPESYQKLDKIGQGTYSTVFKARDLETGKMVALKKVRFDNFEAESIKFMAREILILRRLNHPNVIKLEGIITSKYSCTMYLVFEYMEHDLAGLSSSPDIKFSDSQVKCYMQQLLSGLEHCHSHGVIHRDIKSANLLVNNEGVLKIADFGLANFIDSSRCQPLTSRVVTLWYRPPELLLGSTEYEASVDLWSAGCVFAELFIGKPILQGRTEVEQIHKIFKLCGSPPEEYWRKVKLAHATVFKPQNPYVSCLRGQFNFLPECVFELLESFLSLEPYKRGTAKSALASEYFKSKPYPCEPSSLPKYSPHKEIDVKSREDLQRKRVATREPGYDNPRNPLRKNTTEEFKGTCRIPPRPKDQWSNNYTFVSGKHGSSKENGEKRIFINQQTNEKEHYLYSGPLTASNVSGLIWANSSKDGNLSNHSSTRPNSRQSGSRMDTSSILRPKNILEMNTQSIRSTISHEDYKDHKQCEIHKQAMLKQWIENDHHASLVDSDTNQDYKEGVVSSEEFSLVSDYQDHSDSLIVNEEYTEKHERKLREAARKPFIQRG